MSAEVCCDSGCAWLSERPASCDLLDAEKDIAFDAGYAAGVEAAQAAIEATNGYDFTTNAGRLRVRNVPRAHACRYLFIGDVRRTFDALRVTP